MTARRYLYIVESLLDLGYQAQFILTQAGVEEVLHEELARLDLDLQLHISPLYRIVGEVAQLRTPVSNASSSLPLPKKLFEPKEGSLSLDSETSLKSLVNAVGYSQGPIFENYLANHWRRLPSFLRLLGA